MATTSDHLFDKRLVERHLDRGVLTRDDYEAHLANLSDCAENMDVVAFDEESGADVEQD